VQAFSDNGTLLRGDKQRRLVGKSRLNKLE